MGQMDEVITINFAGTMFHPNYLTGYCMATRASDWVQEAQNEMAKVWKISVMLPNLKAGVILDIVRGKRKMTYEGFTLIIHPPKPIYEEE